MRSGSSEVVRQVIVIESMLAYSSILELAMHHCIFGKDILHVFLSHVKAAYPLWWSSLTKDLQKKKMVLCVGVVRQTRSASSCERTNLKKNGLFQFDFYLITSYNKSSFKDIRKPNI